MSLPSRVLPSHFRLVSGAGAATPFSIYIRAPALINLAHQSVSKQCLHICDNRVVSSKIIAS
jgi:hypothetical protein